jgi:outer membrane protein OmpA-like peptidoglycan-associated protein
MWYANVESKYLINGNKPEIKSVFENTDVSFYSRGSEEGKIAFGAGIGAEARVSKDWKVFANAKYYAAERYESVGANIGVRYLFGKRGDKEDKANKMKLSAAASGVQKKTAAQTPRSDTFEADITKKYDSRDLEEAKAYSQSAVKTLSGAEMSDGVGASNKEKIEKNKAIMLLAASAAADSEKSLEKANEARKKLQEFPKLKPEEIEKINAEISEAELVANQARIKAKGLIEKSKLNIEKAEEEERIKEEEAIKQEMSDAQLAKEKLAAQERRKKEVIKAFNLTLKFKAGSYFLTKESKEYIAKVVEEIKSKEYNKITIEGHADNSGSKELNKRLSRQRAKSVYDEFVKAQISQEKMTYTGFAYEMPIKSNKTAEGRAANRRTEIFVE